MAAYLSQVVNRFQTHSMHLQSTADEILNKKSKIPNWEAQYLSETLVSETWQSWCYLCRSLVLSSCQGCFTVDGVLVPARTDDNSWQRIGYIFRNKTIKNGLLPNQHLEPTWGDVDKFIQAMPIIKPNNESVLLSALGVATLNESAKHLRIVRNFFAHKNAATNASLKNLYVYYSIPSVKMPPYEIIWQLDASGNIAFYSWLSNLQQMALLAGQSKP